MDFGKPKPQADAGVYHKPRLIAAATGRDPEPLKPKPKQEDYNPMQMDLKTRAKINEIGRQHDKEHPRETLHDVENVVSLGAGAVTYMETGSKKAAASVALTTDGLITSAKKLIDAAVPLGKEILDKTSEILGDIFRGTTMNMLDEDNPLG